MIRQPPSCPQTDTLDPYPSLFRCVNTSGVDKMILKCTGTAVVLESQDAAFEAILGGKVKAGDVVVIRYEGPRGGPGMQEMLYPTSYLKSRGLGAACALQIGRAHV